MLVFGSHALLIPAENSARKCDYFLSMSFLSNMSETEMLPWLKSERFVAFSKYASLSMTIMAVCMCSVEMMGSRRTLRAKTRWI